MKQKMKRFLSLFMAIIMVCGILPASASAAGAAPGSVWPNGILWANTGNWFTSTDPQTGASKYHQNIESYIIIGDDGTTQYPVYCVQPGVPVLSSSTDGMTATNIATSDAWAGLSEQQRRAIGLAMLYGYPNGMDSDSYLERRGMQFATQVIIWEIVLGYRSSLPPFSCSNSSFPNMFFPDSTGNAFTDSGSGANNGTVKNFHSAYSALASNLASHYIIPSFASRSKSLASTYNMSLSNGKYTVTLIDENNVLSNCTFVNGDGVTYSVSGNQLTVTSTKPIFSTLASSSKNVPDVDSQSFVFYTKPGYQTMMAITGDQTDDPVPIYFKLNVSTSDAGQIKFTKTTNTGTDLDGWNINLYSDSACTALVGTYTTGSDGTVTTEYLTPGTYYAKEVDESSSKPNWTFDTSKKTITVTAGGVATATFSNSQQGKIEFTKTTNTGTDLDGWKINLYSDSACTKLVNTYTTGSDGTVTTGFLAPGTYYAKEVDESSSYPYWGYDTSKKTITVTAGSTASASFSNTHYGKIKVTKSTNTGANLADWVFEIKNSSGTIVDTITTNASGVATSKNLLPGKYTVTEKASGDSYWSSDTAAKEVTVTAGATASVSVTNTHLGKVQIIKKTNTGSDVGGWTFSIYRDKDCTDLVSTLTTGSDGKTGPNHLTPGTYYFKEVGDQNGRFGTEYWPDETKVVSFTIEAGKDVYPEWTNNHYGKITVTKSTNTGADLDNWVFEIKNSDGKVVDTITTNDKGVATSQTLLPGTYTVTETASSDSYWSSDTAAKTVTVTAGSTASVSVTNTHYGKITFEKETNTGVNLNNWEIKLYSDKDCTNLVGTYKTGTNGKVTTGNLLPGTYYAKETASTNAYWESDSELKTITVVAGETATATFTNTHYGKIKVTKSTNTGDDLADWVFEIKNPAGEVVETLTTGEDGTATSKNLLPGAYTVAERASDDQYWVSDTTAKSVNVIAGSTASVSVTNTHYGKIQITKETINTNSVDGWTFSVYSDSACSKLVGTFTSGANGSVTTGNLLPGTYYVKETGDKNGRWDNEYWVNDADVEAVTVTAGSTASVSFTNTQYGKIHVVKTMDTDGPVNGWEFRITDEDGNEIIGSPFITDENGEILTGILPPGEYTVEEIIPADSLYYTKTTNPMTVTVAAGETVEAPFTNALRPGKITIHKVDVSGNPLADAKFCLEWSKDGTTWTPVHYSDKADVVLGGSSNTDIVDGCLVTGADGVIEWANLYPGIQYRVTEVEAPAGYNLLADTAFEGELPVDDLTVSLRVVNTQVMVLPQTGAADFNWMPICLGVCLSTFAAAVLYLLKKKEEEA